MMEEKDKIIGFYDQFVTRQEKTGINSRHYQIIDKLVSSGLAAGHRVLEIGCGIGTVSHLIAKKTKKGRVLAVDISPESIQKARILWKDQKNLEFEVSDMKNFYKPGQVFDYVIFPDVLEHIPVDQHFSIFETIQRHSHSETSVFIHIPAPRFLEWMTKHEPEKLQVIDQPLDTGQLIKAVTDNRFYLEKMETYSVFFKEKDYQYFVFRKTKPIERTTPLNKWEVLRKRLKIRMKSKLS